MRKTIFSFATVFLFSILFSVSVAANDVTVIIDDSVQNYDVPPQIISGRLMVPMRGIFEALGAMIEWSPEDQIVIALTVDTLIMLQIGEANAFVNGDLKPLDQPATIVGGRTLVPLRFVAEALGADVNWDGETRTATITSAAPEPFELPDIDFNAWALGASAIFAETHNELCTEGCEYDPYLFGMTHDVEALARNVKGTWEIETREELISTIAGMIDGGHSTAFMREYIEFASLPEEEYESFLEMLGDDGYIPEMILEIGDKWGAKLIKAWDWFRMIHLASWGYTLGFVTQNESYELMLPVIERLRDTFSSWDEAGQNYLDGYAWLSRTDRSLPGTEYAHRVRIYNELKTRTGDRNLFDERVWE
jgi:hypothetical protein